MKKLFLLVILVFTLTLVCGCESETTPTEAETPANENSFYDTVVVEEKEISKDEYFNKTLAGLLGHMAGFLSGYEFVWTAGGPYIGMPLEWYEFLNGPYAGNYAHYWPGLYAEGNNRYDRLKVNPETGMNEVWSDDDYHIDIFNQITALMMISLIVFL